MHKFDQFLGKFSVSKKFGALVVGYAGLTFVYFQQGEERLLIFTKNQIRSTYQILLWILLILIFLELFSIVLGGRIPRIKSFINGFLSFANLLLKKITYVIYIMPLKFLFRPILNSLIEEGKLEILEAKYGANGHFIDITSKLQDQIKNNRLEIPLSNQIAGDPINGIVKKGEITYKFNRKKFNISFNENDLISLP